MSKFDFISHFFRWGKKEEIKTSDELSTEEE